MVTQHPCCLQNISSTNLHQFHFISLLNNNIYNIKDTTMYCVCIWSIMSNILILIKKLPYAINKGYSEIICAKYGGSRMNDVCTICPACIVSLPAKVVQPTAFFLKQKAFLYSFCVSHWLANMGVSSWSVSEL